MAEQLSLTAHLTPAAFDADFKETYLGQAHIAGTGPAGRTCRECLHWHLTLDGQPVSPGHYSDQNAEKANCLKPAKCNYPIPHKANRRFPHFAKACRLFDASNNPYPAVKPRDQGEIA